jgi:hypothetical protein
MCEPESVDGGPHPFSDFDCPLAIGTGKDDRDLLSAIAGDYFRGSHNSRHGNADGSQVVVSHLVSVLVVQHQLGDDVSVPEGHRMKSVRLTTINSSLSQCDPAAAVQRQLSVPIVLPHPGMLPNVSARNVDRVGVRP